ncbi:MAG: amino acid adenylation domain-containing protein [Verrucomicrobiota bacterium]
MALLQNFIDEWAERSPEREAFRCGDDALTYRELAVRADRLARALREAGLRRMDRVGILMNKCLEVPVSVYGILKAGGVFVPIDPAAPAARIAFILRDCGIRFLITESDKAVLVSGLAKETAGLEYVIGLGEEVGHGVRVDNWAAMDTVCSGDVEEWGTEQDLAYLMYTSGSTGEPKGLMHTHYSGLSYARLSARAYDVQAGDRLGNHAALHFDQSTFDYFTGPMCGATTVLVPEEVIMFPMSLGELIERERLTFWYSVPLTLVRLVETGALEGRDCSAMRWVLFGGEAFPPKYLWRLMDLWPGARFSNCYGPAEVNQCTYYHVPRERKGSEDALPIGGFWEDTEGLIMDGEGREVLLGEAGELLVRSPTMMAGYWGRDDLNARAFFERERFPGYRETFYRTGDLVRADDAGQLHFLGRKDRQVKIRGHRVELEEVESALACLEEVAEGAVFVVGGGDVGEERLVGAVILRAGVEVDGAAMRRSLGAVLPSYAVPLVIEIYDRFPRTTSGKIDRRELAACYVAGDGEG